MQSDEAPRNGFECRVCRQWHNELPMSYSVKVPLPVAAIPESDLDQRVEFTPDQCIVDGRDFYLRGRIVVPVIGADQPFIWGVWVLVEKDDFLRTHEMWKESGREAEMPYRGWLTTQIPVYGDALNLAVNVVTQVVGRRPHFELIDRTHPLAIEQKNGISMLRVQEFAEILMHPESRPPALC